MERSHEVDVIIGHVVCIIYISIHIFAKMPQFTITELDQEHVKTLQSQLIVGEAIQKNLIIHFILLDTQQNMRTLAMTENWYLKNTHIGSSNNNRDKTNYYETFFTFFSSFSTKQADGTPSTFKWINDSNL